MGVWDFISGRLWGRDREENMLLAYGREYGSSSRRDRPVYVDRSLLTNQNGVVIGGSGSGKTRLMFHQILWQIKEIARGKAQSIILIDPEGDAFRNVLRAVAAIVTEGHEELADRLVVIDPTYDRERYGIVGYNVIEPEEDEKPFEVISELLTCFQAIWGKTGGFGDRMADILTNTFRILQSNGLTLAEALSVLTDEDYVRKLLPAVTEESVLLFWENHFLNLDRRERRVWVESSRNKLNAFCNSNPYLLPMFGQAKSTISFRRIINDGKICLINASKNHLKGSRNLFCSLLLAKIYMALLARETMEEAQRIPVYIHVDELPEVYNPSSIQGMLSEGRKYGSGFTGYLQNPAQFDPRDIDNVMGNCAMQIVFWVDRKGAERLAKELFNFNGMQKKSDGGGYSQPRYWSIQEEVENAVNELSGQRPKECYIRLQGICENPYIATIPEVGYPPPMPEMESRLREISASKYNRSLDEIGKEFEERRLAFQEMATASQKKGAEREDSKGLSANEEIFLRDVHTRPFVLLTRRYEDLSARISKSAASRIKIKLAKLGFVEEIPLNLGKKGGQPKLLKLTDKGCEYLKLDSPYKNMGKGGFEHIFWQNAIAQNYRNQGYKVTIEDSVGRDAADLGMEKDGIRIAIEVTLHSENVARNVERDLGAGYAQIWLACPDAAAAGKVMGKLEAEMGSAALEGRVIACLLAEMAGDI